MTSYKQTLNYLFSLQNSGIKLGLERTLALSSLLGFPYNAYPTVLVAGTNGKGSTSAMLASILGKAGYRVGLYTSPHLMRFNERIRVSDELISDFELVELTEKIRLLVEGNNDEPGLSPELLPTFFEFTTVLAFRYFQQKRVDIAILEVGMGGRLDATNVVSPLLSVITSIGLDHESSLGGDVALVAGEKGGIIKEGGVVLCGDTPPEAKEVIERISNERGARLYLSGRDYQVTAESRAGFHYTDSCGEIAGLKVALYGAHQRQNAALAVKALALLSKEGFKSTEEEIKQGLMDVSWPGRCEIVRESPKVVLDCAHNESAASALSEALSAFTYNRLILVLGIMCDKDTTAILSKLAPMADAIILTAPDIERAEKPERLLEKMMEIILTERLNVKSSVAGSVDVAIEVALEMAHKDDLICISGSVFTVGEASILFE